MFLFNFNHLHMFFTENFFFLFSIIVFFSFIGIFVLRENLILILISLEMIFLAVISLFLVSGLIFEDSLGQLCVLVFLAVAAVESAISLAIFVVFYRLTGCTSLLLIGVLKT